MQEILPQDMDRQMNCNKEGLWPDEPVLDQMNIHHATRSRGNKDYNDDDEKMLRHLDCLRVESSFYLNYL